MGGVRGGRQARAETRGKGAIRGRVRSGVRSDRTPAVGRRRPAREATTCVLCGATFARKVWRLGAPGPAAAETWTLCPACSQLADGEYFGRVVARGRFVAAHEAEIRRRIGNVAARARFTQPERQLEAVERRGDEIEVLTTSQKLAHRIARELEKAFGGHVTYAWSDRDGALLAVWEHPGGRTAARPLRHTRHAHRRAG
jgi:hypothetical protein